MIIVNINLPCLIKGCVVDVETTGLTARIGELITCGILRDSGLSVIQRTEESNSEFTKYVNVTLAELERPLYAFNKAFEEGFCHVPISCNLQFYEESTYYALKRDGLLSLYNLLGDPLRGAEVPVFWSAYMSLHEPIFLSKIIRHNYCCLVKEYYLKLVRFDGVDVGQVEPLINSAIIEAKWIALKLEALKGHEESLYVQ